VKVREVARIERRVEGGESVAYLHDDHQNSPVAFTDERGTVTTLPLRDPFGQAVSGSPAPLELGFTAYRKEASGLLDAGARYYDPLTAQFLSPDPLVGNDDQQGLHPYAMLRNSPLTGWDPGGLTPQCDELYSSCPQESGGLWGALAAAGAAVVDWLTGDDDSGASFGTGGLPGRRSGTRREAPEPVAPEERPTPAVDVQGASAADSAGQEPAYQQWMQTIHPTTVRPEELRDPISTDRLLGDTSHDDAIDAALAGDILEFEYEPQLEQMEYVLGPGRTFNVDCAAGLCEVSVQPLELAAPAPGGGPAEVDPILRTTPRRG